MPRSSRALFNEKNKDKGERMKKLDKEKFGPSMQSYQIQEAFEKT